MQIVVSLEARTAEFTTDIDRASKAAAKDLQRMRAESEKALKDFGKLIGAAAATAAVGLAAMVKGALENADELGKLSQKVGVAVDDLSKLAYAAKLSDVDLGSLQQGLVKLSNAAVEAQKGTGQAADAFKQLGISVTDSEGRLKSNNDLLLELADSFSHLEDGPQKAALAMDIFGKAGADLIPLLNGGRQAIQEAGAELEKFGGVVTPEAAKAAEEFNDNLTRLQTSAGGLANQIAGELAPDLAALTGRLIDFNKETANSAKVADGLRVALRGVVGAGIVVGNVFQIAGDNIGAVAAAAAALAHGDFGTAMEIIKLRFSDLKTDLSDIWHAFDEGKAPVQEAKKELDAFADPLAALRDIPLPDFKIQVEQIQKAKDLTDAWGVALQAAAEIADEAQRLSEEQRDTQSRQDDIGLNAAADIQDEVDAMEDAEEKKTEILQREERIRQRIREDAVAAAVDALGYAAEAAQEFGKEGFQAFKAFTIAQTIIDTYAAAQATYKALAGIPYAGPALAVAGAAAAVAAGLARVNAIRNAEPSGYATGGLVGGGEQTIRVNERGPEFVVNAQATRRNRGLLEAINDGALDAGGAATGVQGGVNLSIINSGSPMAVRRVERDGGEIRAYVDNRLDAIEDEIAAGVLDGTGSLGSALSNTFGIQRGSNR